MVVRTTSFEVLLEGVLNRGVMLIFFNIRAHGCLPITSPEKYCLT
jgi:hypothetical protein